MKAPPQLQRRSVVPGNTVWLVSEEHRAHRLGAHFKASEKRALRVERRTPSVPLEAGKKKTLPPAPAGILRSIPLLWCPLSFRELSSVLKRRRVQELRGSRFSVPVLISHFVLHSHGWRRRSRGLRSLMGSSLASAEAAHSAAYSEWNPRYSRAPR